MNWLVRLYPRWWRERYGGEFAALLEDLSGTRARWRLVVDIWRVLWTHAWEGWP